MKAYLDAFSLPSPSHPDANHDAYFALPQQQAAGVFDGVGRSAGARLAAITARDSFVQRIQTPLRSRPQFVADAFSSAYTAVLNVADSNPGAGYTGATALVVWSVPGAAWSGATWATVAYTTWPRAVWRCFLPTTAFWRRWPTKA